ncbi:uncharacterized protein [Neodiprion pinetum]|uniref:Uncharacterized protein LOC107228151 n=1 Tax=Neodiprion lecontei TaxID=441921 RepID=A0A6J0CE47_NEOLC|nr:uncharacterized protein LOC107228151 [Neodiprion lecontei]XP_046436242.1 uncharacterized protein LOC124188021 [Neodiprion fabricii]XP_046464750.1 uncharacterized protein LOC124210632 [Neodiprion pinetum]XP_046625548.1 uncharacterized protein LOC124307659 [Neodiprion virginianus]
MSLNKILILVAASAILNFVNARPDSAGMVEMTNGLAYGGIPYGSVSGMVAKYGNSNTGQISSYAPANPRSAPSLVMSQNSRRPSIVPAPGSGAPVQIFSHPGVVAPGVVGMIHSVGYQ